MRVFRMLCLLAAFVFVPGAVIAQQQRIDSPTVASPRGSASTQVGGVYNAAGAYQGGAWIVVDYGRPILRGRQGLFGAGETYGDDFLVGAPIWRVGANQSTRFKTEIDLMFGGQRLAAGDYSVSQIWRRMPGPSCSPLGGSRRPSRKTMRMPSGGRTNTPPSGMSCEPECR